MKSEMARTTRSRRVRRPARAMLAECAIGLETLVIIGCSENET